MLIISTAADLNSCSALWSVDHKTPTTASSCSHNTSKWAKFKVVVTLNKEFNGAITNSYMHLLSVTSQPKQQKAAMQIKEANSTFCIYALKQCFKHIHITIYMYISYSWCSLAVSLIPHSHTLHTPTSEHLCETQWLGAKWLTAL